MEYLFCCVSKSTLDKIKGYFEEIVKVQDTVPTENSIELKWKIASDILIHIEKEEIFIHDFNPMEEILKRRNFKFKC